MADTDYTVDAALVDGGLVVGVALPASPPMHPPVRRAEKVATPSAVRVDE